MRDHFLPLRGAAGLVFTAGFVAAVFFGIARSLRKLVAANTTTTTTNRRFGSGEWYGRVVYFHVDGVSHARCWVVSQHRHQPGVGVDLHVAHMRADAARER